MGKPVQIVLYVSKLAAAFATPLGASLVLAILGLAIVSTGRRRVGISVILLSLIALWAAATPIVARLSLGALERQYPILSAAETPQADVAIILGGAVEPAIPPRREADLGEATDRIVFALELFLAGKVRKILISGGNLPWKSGPDARPEAETISGLLVTWSVTEDAIITEGGRQTTPRNSSVTAQRPYHLQCRMTTAGDCDAHGVSVS